MYVDCYYFGCFVVMCDGVGGGDFYIGDIMFVKNKVCVFFCIELNKCLCYG